MKKATGRREEQPTKTANRTPTKIKKAAYKISEKTVDENSKNSAEINEEKTVDKIARGLKDGRQTQREDSYKNSEREDGQPKQRENGQQNQGVDSQQQQQV